MYQLNKQNQRLTIIFTVRHNQQSTYTETHKYFIWLTFQIGSRRAKAANWRLFLNRTKHTSENINPKVIHIPEGMVLTSHKWERVFMQFSSKVGWTACFRIFFSSLFFFGGREVQVHALILLHSSQSPNNILLNSPATWSHWTQQQFPQHHNPPYSLQPYSSFFYYVRVSELEVSIINLHL